MDAIVEQSKCRHPDSRVDFKKLEYGFWIFKIPIGYSAHVCCKTCGFCGPAIEDTNVESAIHAALVAWRDLVKPFCGLGWNGCNHTCGTDNLRLGLTR